jgi:lipid-A-disaccharide synthase
VAVLEGVARPVLRQARAALVASGTATLEAALLDCPTVIVYRTSLLTAALARCLLRVPHVGIVNLIAGREVCPERLQFAARPRALAAALLPLIEDGPARAAMLRGYAEVRAALGPPGAAERAAEIVLRALGVSR